MPVSHCGSYFSENVRTRDTRDSSSGSSVHDSSSGQCRWLQCIEDFFPCTRRALGQAGWAACRELASARPAWGSPPRTRPSTLLHPLTWRSSMPPSSAATRPRCWAATSELSHPPLRRLTPAIYPTCRLGAYLPRAHLLVLHNRALYWSCSLGCSSWHSQVGVLRDHSQLGRGCHKMVSSGCGWPLAGCVGCTVDGFC